MTLPKFSKNDPVFFEHGIDYVMGSNAVGKSMQSITWDMEADGILTFAEHGLSDMANTTYQVLAFNWEDPADPLITGITKTTSSITFTGPDTGDALDIMICGQLATQKIV